MSSEWQDTTLGQICAAQGGAIQTGPFGSQLHTSDYREFGIPVVMPTNIGDGGIVEDGIARIDQTDVDRLSQHTLRMGDIVFSRRGDVTKNALIRPHEVGWFCGTGCLKVRLGDESIATAKFISHCLRLPDIKDWLIRHAVGATMPNLNTGILSAVPIYLPPLRVQLEIAAMLGALDDRITLLRNTNATLEAIAQALFKSWFVDFDPVRAKMEGRAPEGMDEATAALFPDTLEESELGWVPKGWRVLRLGDATERITKGTTPTTLKRPFVDQGINFVKAESMTGDGGFVPEKFAFIDDETHALLRRSQLQDGDVLISIAGTIGRIAVMTKDFLPANTNQAVALIRPFAKILPSGWINRFLRLSESQNKMGEKVVQAVQANLSLGTLSDLKLVVPPEAVVGTLYESGLAQIDASWVANEQRVRTLATLRDTLLPRLISGQLRLPEAQALVAAA